MLVVPNKHNARVRRCGLEPQYGRFAGEQPPPGDFDGTTDGLLRIQVVRLA